jgi:hypothetical protein
MITFTLNGRSVEPDDIGDAFLRAVADQIKERLHEQLSSVRNPATGEFPTVVVTGDTIENISARVEGSPELLSLVRERLDPG